MRLFYNDGRYDTDYPHAITRMGFVQSHHLALSGGSEQSNYRASVENPTFPFDVNAEVKWKKNGNASQINPHDALLNQLNDERSYIFLCPKHFEH